MAVDEPGPQCTYSFDAKYLRNSGYAINCSLITTPFKLNSYDDKYYACRLQSWRSITVFKTGVGTISALA